MAADPEATRGVTAARRARDSPDDTAVPVGSPARTWFGVKDGVPLVPPVSVAPNVQASTAPLAGTSLSAPTGL